MSVSSYDDTEIEEMNPQYEYHSFSDEDEPTHYSAVSPFQQQLPFEYPLPNYPEPHPVEYIFHNTPPENDILDDICEIEEVYMDMEKENGQYVIGISAAGFNHQGSIFACGVSPRTFFRFPYRDVLKYLFYYSIINVYYPVIDVIQIHIDADQTYLSIRKTYWLCLIQRHWKKVVAERMRVMQQRRTLCSQMYFNLRGRYPPSLNTMPSLPGMMSCYAKPLDSFIESQ